MHFDRGDASRVRAETKAIISGPDIRNRGMIYAPSSKEIEACPCAQKPEGPASGIEGPSDPVVVVNGQT